MASLWEQTAGDTWRYETGIKKEEIDKALASVIPGVTQARVFNPRFDEISVLGYKTHDHEMRTVKAVVGQIIIFEGKSVLTCTALDYAKYLRDPHVPIYKGFTYRNSESAWEFNKK